MSLLTINNDLLTNEQDLKPLLDSFFDKIDLNPDLSQDGYNSTFIVEKVSMGFIYGDLQVLELTFNRTPTTVLPANVDKYPLEIISVNGLSTNTRRDSTPLLDANLTFEQRSQGSGHGVKSKG